MGFVILVQLISVQATFVQTTFDSNNIILGQNAHIDKTFTWKKTWHKTLSHEQNVTWTKLHVDKSDFDKNSSANWTDDQKRVGWGKRGHGQGERDE